MDATALRRDGSQKGLELLSEAHPLREFPEESDRLRVGLANSPDLSATEQVNRANGIQLEQEQRLSRRYGHGAPENGQIFHVVEQDRRPGRRKDHQLHGDRRVCGWDRDVKDAATGIVRGAGIEGGIKDLGYVCWVGRPKSHGKVKITGGPRNTPGGDGHPTDQGVSLNKPVTLGVFQAGGNLS